MRSDVKYEPKSLATALDAPSGKLDAAERDFVIKVRQYGWHLTNVFGDEKNPSFSYSTAVWLNTGFPEIVVFSLKPEIAKAVLWDVFRDVQAGSPPPIGMRPSKIFADLDAVLLPCAKKHYRDLLGWSRWFYGGDTFDCVQLVWPDKSGWFPWESEFEQRFHGLQPDLTERGWLSEIAN